MPATTLTPATLAVFTIDARPLSLPCRFLQRGPVILLEVDERQLFSWEAVEAFLRRRLAEEGMRPLRSYLDVPEATPDAVRGRLTAAGWPLRYETHAEAVSVAARFEGELPEQLASQAADPAQPAAEPPHSGAVRYGELEHGTEKVLRRSIEARGGIVLYAAPALSRPDSSARTCCGPITEMAYHLAGVRRYVYLVFYLGVHDWHMSYVVVSQRLDAGAAAAALDAARRRPLTSS